MALKMKWYSSWSRWLCRPRGEKKFRLVGPIKPHTSFKASSHKAALAKARRKAGKPPKPTRNWVCKLQVGASS